MKKYLAELIGTFALVFFGCGTVIFMLDEVGLLGVAFAFGLTVTAMAYSIGHISGAHLNPAVSLGMLTAGRMDAGDFIGYAVAQVAGGILAAVVLYVIVSGKVGGYDIAANGFAANGWQAYGMFSALVYEIDATFLFVTVILGSTQPVATNGLAGVVIGLTLVVIHLAGIVVSGSSVNPARSIGPALFAGGAALGQLWLYIVAPLIGGAAAGLVFKAGVTAVD
jgi:aquaporin Z